MNGSWISSTSIFLFPRFSASNESSGCDGKLWSAVVCVCVGGAGRGGGGRGYRVMMKVSCFLISDVRRYESCLDLGS